MNNKFIFFTGKQNKLYRTSTVLASLGYAIKMKGYSVNAIKIETEVNSDSQAHSESYIIDNISTSFDLGIYERLMSMNLSSKSSIISKSNEDILNRLNESVDKSKDINLIEISSTIEDPLEIINEFRTMYGFDSVYHIHIDSKVDLDLIPNMVMVRTDVKLSKDYNTDIAYLPRSLDNIYLLPSILENQGTTNVCLSYLGLQPKPTKLLNYGELIRMIPKRSKVKLAIVGRFTSNKYAYLSVEEALLHASLALNKAIDIKYIEAQSVNKDNAKDVFKGINGVILPGGFGSKGLSGLIDSAEYLRTHNIPTFGICLGMQIESIEFARNVLHLKDANSMEFNDKTKNPVIDYCNINKLPNVGLNDIKIKDQSLLKKIYEKTLIKERHVHIFKLNQKYLPQFTSSGFVETARDNKNNIVEALELNNHSYYLGVQYHPECLSRIDGPHPLFVSFIKAALKKKEEK